MIGCPVLHATLPFHTTHEQRGRNPAASIQIHLPPFPPLAFHHLSLFHFFPNSSHRQNKPTLGLSSGPRQDRPTQPNQTRLRQREPTSTSNTYLEVALPGISIYLDSTHPPTHAAQQTHAYGLHGNLTTRHRLPLHTYLSRPHSPTRPTDGFHAPKPAYLYARTHQKRKEENIPPDIPCLGCTPRSASALPLSVSALLSPRCCDGRPATSLAGPKSSWRSLSS